MVQGFGVDICRDLIWHGHIVNLAVAAGKKLGFPCRARRYFSGTNVAKLYKAQIQPGAKAVTTFTLLDSLQKRAIRFTDDLNITRNPRHIVAL